MPSKPKPHVFHIRFSEWNQLTAHILILACGNELIRSIVLQQLRSVSPICCCQVPTLFLCYNIQPTQTCGSLERSTAQRRSTHTAVAAAATTKIQKKNTRDQLYIFSFKVFLAHSCCCAVGNYRCELHVALYTFDETCRRRLISQNRIKKPERILLLATKTHLHRCHVAH